MCKFIIASEYLEMQALFLSDNCYDHEVAKLTGLDFIFIHEWTEFKNWQDYCGKNKIPLLNSIADLHNFPGILFKTN